jgi:hypothetical protein
MLRGNIPAQRGQFIHFQNLDMPDECGALKRCADVEHPAVGDLTIELTY